MRDALRRQDGLLRWFLRRSNGTLGARVDRVPIIEYLFAPNDPGAAIEKMAEPATRIVSLTVTEGGYHLNAVTGDFDGSDPAVLADLQPGATPRTVLRWSPKRWPAAVTGVSPPSASCPATTSVATAT